MRSLPFLRWLLLPLALLLMVSPVAAAPADAPASGPAEAGPAQPAIIYFPETGFGIRDPLFADYFVKRGGLRTFGYPVSRTVQFLGFRTQFFQRQIMQLGPDGQVRLLNLLDPDLMPYTRINGSTFPEIDPEVVAATPGINDPNYDVRIQEFVRAYSPEEWQGRPVRFYTTFLNTVRYEDAFPRGDGDPYLVPLLNLELWGVPRSRPRFDPANRNFIYLRYQRGIMHYDESCRCTQGLLLADYLKSIITGSNLPPDLEEQARGSRFYLQYDNRQPLGIRRPADLPGTNLKDGFEPEDGRPGPAPLPTPTATVVPPAGVNLALFRPVTASSTESSRYSAARAVDGDLSTRWSSQFSDSQWFQVDLQGTYSIDRVVIRWEESYARAYRIDVSSDGANWATIFSTANGRGGTESIAGNGVVARYVRFTGLRRATSFGYSFWEFEVYGQPAYVPPPPPPPTWTPLPTSTPVPIYCAASASVSDPTPRRDSTMQVYVTFTCNGQGVRNAQTYAIAHYRAGDDREPDGDPKTTNSSGQATIEFEVPRNAARGYTVTVDVYVSYQGNLYQTRTSFTPR